MHLQPGVSYVNPWGRLMHRYCVRFQLNHKAMVKKEELPDARADELGFDGLALPAA